MFFITFMLVAIFVAIILVGMFAIREMNYIELQLQIIKHTAAIWEAELGKANISLSFICENVAELRKQNVVVVSESEIITTPDAPKEKKMDDFFREVPGSERAV